MHTLKATSLTIAFLLTFGGSAAFCSEKSDASKPKAKSKMASILPKEKREALRFWTRLNGTASAEGKTVDQYFKEAKTEWEHFEKAHPKVAQVMLKHSKETAEFRKERMKSGTNNLSPQERRQRAQDTKMKMLEMKKRHKAEIHAAIEEEGEKSK